MNHLTVQEVAVRLQVNPSKVRAWIRSGQLVATDVSLNPGGQARYRVSMEEFERFQKRREVAVAPAKRRRRSKVKQTYTRW